VKAFHAPRTSLGDLDADAAAALITAAADIALILDEAGIIRDLACNSEELAGALPKAASWLGQPWIETLAKDSRGKAKDLIRPGEGRPAKRWRQLSQIAADGTVIPVLYAAAPIDGTGRILVLGRDLRPFARLQQRVFELQQSLERDYARLREAENRYRLLFQTSPDPMLLLDATTQRVTEANPAALRILGKDPRRVIGRPVAEAFAAGSRVAVQSLLSALRSGGRHAEARAKLAEGATEVTVSAATFRQEGALLCLLRIALSEASAKALPPGRSALLELLDAVPDGFVVTDTEGRILAASAAFIEMIEAASEEQLRGQPLARWLGTQEVEAEVLFGHLRSRGSVRLYASTLRGEQGGRIEVEISAARVTHGGSPGFGFAMRDVGVRIRPALQAAAPSLRSVEQLKERIGRVPLKDLVREATDAIERLCIEAALELSGDNRASAAEMLGLSRQSLYVKLRRYGLGDLGAEAGEGG